MLRADSDHCSGFRWCSTHRRAALLVLLMVGAGSATDRTDRQPKTAGGEEFTIGRNGRLVLLPVQLGQRPIRCMVDTGASLTGFDESLRDELGDLQGTQPIETPAGTKSVEFFACPTARLGRESLNPDGPVVCVDLEMARRASGKDIRGVIGMDVLRTRRMQIDFDRGTLRFLNALPTDRSQLGEKVPLTFPRGGAPCCDVLLGEAVRKRFLLDTGAHGISVEASVFDELVDEQQIRSGTPFTSVTVAGAVQGGAGRLTSLAVGPFQHAGLRVVRLNTSTLGMRYLARFQVTFDFPGKALYLRPGERYSIPDLQATSGMTLSSSGTEKVIESVLPDGPADTAGLRPKDILVRIDGRNAADFDHFRLRELLTSEVGKQVPITVRRGQREIDAVLVLIEI